MNIRITNTNTGSVASADLAKCRDGHYYRLDYGGGFLIGWKRGGRFMLESATGKSLFALERLDDGTFTLLRVARTTP